MYLRQSTDYPAKYQTGGGKEQVLIPLVGSCVDCFSAIRFFFDALAAAIITTQVRVVNTPPAAGLVPLRAIACTPTRLAIIRSTVTLDLAARVPCLPVRGSCPIALIAEVIATL